MNFLPDEIEQYVDSHTRQEPEILKKLDRETYAKVMMPRMLSGHLQGRFLKMICSMVNPTQVLEVGTYTGYSALCLAEGLSQRDPSGKEGGMVHTIDINEELHPMVMRYIKEAGMENKIKAYIGNALDIIPTLNYTFDLVFIDADKENYSKYYELAINKLRPGGFIVADNVLWSGKVLASKDMQDDETRSLIAYNDMVMKDPRVENVLVPIRDGLMIARKIT
ncbi:MAG TPA: O-methyltransferase [Bacteroidia bacterium]|jgi:caffeoyl-CoA O-methyltransferase|nr:O-methyltransferase [Bacteroidia bacterium]